MDNDQISDLSDDSNDNETIINGLFGVTKVDNFEHDAVRSDCDNGCNLETTDNSTGRSDCSNDYNKKTADKMSIQNKARSEESYHNIGESIESKNCVTVENTSSSKINKSFGSRLFSDKFTHDHFKEPSSFATINENYEKSRKDGLENSNLLPENPTNCDQELDSVSMSNVVISKKNVPSTLFLISQNYQDSSSDDTEEDSDTNFDDNNSIIIDSDNESVMSSLSNPYLNDEEVKTRGELDISDLPPIEDLKISIEEEKCKPVGCIKNIVDTLVIVEGFFNEPALDIDSVIFVDRGQRALGKIFDVFGPISKPFYAIRFNNSEHIIKFDIQIKEPVYCAPHTEYASFVSVSQLLKVKGSDASWKHNNEPPPEFLDYSDDEEEKMAKKNRKQGRCQNTENYNADKKEESPEPQNTHACRNKNNTPSVSTTINNTTVSTPRSFANSVRPQRAYTPRIPHVPNYNNYTPLSPTYAQLLSSMNYNQSYRQPYNAWYYNQMYVPRPPSYPYRHPYTASEYNKRFLQQPYDPNNPNQYHYSNPNYR